MSEKEYAPLTKKEIEQAFQYGNASEISETLVVLALYDTDWKKVQTYCLEFLEHPDASVRAVAATCIGHLARINKTLDLDIVFPALYRHQSDSGRYVAGNVENALSDIEIFMHIPVKHDPSMVVENNVKGEIEEEEECLLTAEEIEQALQSDNTTEINRALLELAIHNPDWRKTETYCIEFLEYSDKEVRGTAAECISHLIYNQHHLDVEPARAALLRHLSDPSTYVVKKIKRALSDIELFIQESEQENSTTEEDNGQEEGDK